MRDGLNLRGTLSVTLRRARDGATRRIVVANTITYDGIDSPLCLWAPDGLTLSDYDFRTLRVGDTNVPPTRGDVGLPGEFLSLAIDNGAQRIRSPGQVEVRATIGLADGLGNTCREFGIFLGNGNLFARQTTPDIALTGVFTVVLSWRVAVSAT